MCVCVRECVCVCKVCGNNILKVSVSVLFTFGLLLSQTPQFKKKKVVIPMLFMLSFIYLPTYRNIYKT
jgi:hypothetical protein